MTFTYNDGGREAAGFKGAHAGDCVARSIAIVTGKPYRLIWDALAHGNACQRRTKRSTKSTGKHTANNGIVTARKWFADYMRDLGFQWVPTMHIGSGCKVHLRANELPAGKLVVNVSRHLTAVINGVIHDTYNPDRNGLRCVYGYWLYQS